jgi:hypothetical protein
MSANFNVRPSDRIQVAATIDPQSASSAKTSDWVSMETYDSVLVLIAVGALGSSGTVDAVIHQATDSSGTGAKVLSPTKAITQLTQAGSDDNKQVKINIRGDELDRANSFNHIAVVVTPATAASEISAVIVGANSKLESDTTELASVAETV